jgi:hypothetical protein
MTLWASESVSPVTAQRECDPSYVGVCIPPPPPDLDCGEITERNFEVVGADPHDFDRDHDGVGCEESR